MRSLAVLTFLMVGGLACSQAEGGPVNGVLRRHGWLFGPGYHAFTCCQQRPHHGGAVHYLPSTLPPVPPETVVAPTHVGHLPGRHAMGYPLMADVAPTSAVPLSGTQPIRLPLVTPEAGIPAMDTIIQQPAATVARDIFMPPAHRQ